MSSWYVRVTPSCCEPMRAHQPIYVTLAFDATHGYVNPTWALAVPESRADIGDCEVLIARAPSFCPFCRAVLPAIVPRPNLTAHVHEPDLPYGDYCCSCHERAMHCRCAPPAAAYMPATGDLLDVNALWQRAENAHQQWLVEDAAERAQHVEERARRAAGATDERDPK